MPFSSKTKWLLPHSRGDRCWAAAILVLVAIYIVFFAAMKSLSHNIYFQFKEKQLEVLPQYVIGSDLQFCDTCSGLAQTVRLEGWSQPERWGMWSDGKQASLGIRLPEQLPDQLLLTVRLVTAIGVDGQQAIDLVINGQKTAHWIFHHNDKQEVRSSVVSRSIAAVRQPMQVSFVIDHPVAPSSLGSSSDGRLLGVGLLELRIEENR
jgi:hypothetical protein